MKKVIWFFLLLLLLTVLLGQEMATVLIGLISIVLVLMYWIERGND